MNVALFPSQYHPHVGGVETMCRAFAGRLLDAGHRVCVLTNRWPRNLPAVETIEGIRVHRLAMRIAGDSLKSKATAALTAAWVRRETVRVLRNFEADLIHVHCVSANAAYALHAKVALSLPLVVTLHGELTMDASELFVRSTWAQQVLRRSLGAADAITACSAQTLAEAEAWYAKPFGVRGRVIHNGISLAESTAAALQPYQHGRPYLLAMGRHVPQKGFDVLLRAMATLVRAGETSHDLILAGDGEAHGTLRQLAAELNLGSRVHFPGRVDHATACRLFAGCAMFVLPSRHEPFGIVNLEAMAAGKAVIASRVGGVAEVVIDGETGLLVEGEDVQALVRSIARLIDNPAERDRMGAAGQARARMFSWDEIGNRYLIVYQDLAPICD